MIEGIRSQNSTAVQSKCGEYVDLSDRHIVYDDRPPWLLKAGVFRLPAVRYT
jgi:hypothetical protein